MEQPVASWCRWLPLVLLMMTAIDYTVDTIEGNSMSKNKDRSLWLYPEIQSHAAVNIGHKMMEISSAEASMHSPSGIGRILLSLTKRHSKLNEKEELTSEPDSPSALEAEKSESHMAKASATGPKDSIGTLEAKNSNQNLPTVAHKDSPNES